MKKIVQKSLPGIFFLATVTTAFAEAGARKDDSMMLVYLFLAVCALIIFLQLIPVFALAYGIIKGFFGHSEDETKPVPVRHR
jgi:hypothetical protein